MKKGETFLILGGGGMIGAQVVHEIARELDPRMMVICSRNDKEVKELIDHCKREFPEVEFAGFWGDVFIRADWNNEDEEKQLTRAELIASPELRNGLFDDVFHDVDAAYNRSQLVNLILEHKPDVVVDSINTATAISYQDVYTASELIKNSFNALKSQVERVESNDTHQLINQAEKDLDALLISQSIPQLIRHVLLIQRAMTEAKTRLYLKIGTTGTGGMGLNIPYTHSEDKPSARLMTKTAIAFAHTGLMFLMARTPGGPIVKELKPGAMVGYSNITRRTIRERGAQGNPLHLYQSRRERLDKTLTLKQKEETYEPLGQLEMVIVDTGENGFFTKGEFEAITHMGQMEYITPEEIAHQAVLEIKGSNTGYDVIAAVDSTVMNPTYRAGCLRQLALDEATNLEESWESGADVAPSVALGQLGPPEIGKLLWEAYLLKKRFKTLRKVINLQAENLAAEISELLESEPKILHTINAVGLPVLTLTGRSLLRGPFIRIPEIPGVSEVQLTDEDIDKWGKKGWVDLRPQNFECWRKRFEQMELSTKHIKEKGSAAATRESYPYKDIHIGAVVAWIFNNEILGYRIK